MFSTIADAGAKTRRVETHATSTPGRQTATGSTTHVNRQRDTRVVASWKSLSGERRPSLDDPRLDTHVSGQGEVVHAG